MRQRKAIAGIIIIGSIVTGVLLFWHQPEGQPPSQQTAQASPLVSLGITYLRVSPELVAHYHLGVDSGAMVTEVASGGPAEQAGIRRGDVILVFNGTRLTEGTPLLGMIRKCCSQCRIQMEIWRENSTRTVEVVPIAKN